MVTVTCAGCGKEFEAQRRTAKFCGPTCRQRGRRRGPAGEDKGATETEAPAETGLVETYRAALAEVDRLNTPQGQHVLVLAKKMTSAFETGSGIAALSRQLDVVFERAMKGTGRGDQVDEFTRRLREKQSRATG